MKKYLFTPGPAPVPPEVLLEMGRPIIHHRTPEFSTVLDLARRRIQPLYGTSSEVVLLASTGTGAMEAAVVNLLQPGEHAIYVNGGKFGERWGKLLAAFGMVGHEVRVEWGRAARPEQIEDAFKAHPESRAVLRASQRDLDLRGASDRRNRRRHAAAQCDAHRRRHHFRRRVRAEDGRMGRRCAS